MNTTYCGADNCGTPVHSTTLCRGCEQKLTRRLADVPWLVDELRTVTSRQTRYGRESTRSKSTDAPLILDTRGSKVADALTHTLGQWQQRIADHLGEPVRYPNPVTSSAYMLAAMRGDRLHAWPDAGKMLAELTDQHRRIIGTIDMPPDRWSAGPCNATITAPTGESIECGAGLYAIVGAQTVTCRRCAAKYDVKERRDWLLEHAYDQDATATIIVRALVTLTDGVSDAKSLHQNIRTWAHRNQLIARRHLLVGKERRPMYRVGDVRDLLAEQARREHERTLKRERGGK